MNYLVWNIFSKNKKRLIVILKVIWTVKFNDRGLQHAFKQAFNGNIRVLTNILM